MAQIVLLRHGQTEWSANGRHTSYTDLDLTPAGEEQAREVGRKIAGRTFAAVLSSPRKRALRTAELAGLTVTGTTEDLAEWNYGDYEGIRTREIRETRPDWSLWTDGCPGGESPADVAARCDGVVADLLAAQGDVALFAHGHVLRMLAARWIGLAADGGGRLALSTGSISVLGFEREMRVVWRWNDV